MASIVEQTQKNLSDGDINELRASRFFYVASSTPIDPVFAASLAPDYFSTHPSDSSLLMKQKRGKSLAEEAGRYKWEIQCDYSNRIIRPLDQPAQIEWDFSESSESYFYDETAEGDDCPCGDSATADGCPVVNSAGMPFDSIPTRETGSITANIAKNVAVDFDVSTFLSFREKINDGGFTVDGVSLDADQAKVSGANVSPPQLSNGDWYRVAKLVLKFKKDWKDNFADMGYYELDPDSPGQVKAIVVGTPPQPTQKPYPLDGSGAAKDAATDKPEKLTYLPYEEDDFSSLSALLS